MNTIIAKEKMNENENICIYASFLSKSHILA